MWKRLLLISGVLLVAPAATVTSCTSSENAESAQVNCVTGLKEPTLQSHKKSIESPNEMDQPRVLGPCDLVGSPAEQRWFDRLSADNCRILWE